MMKRPAVQPEITDEQLEDLLAFGKTLKDRTGGYTRGLEIVRQARIALGKERAYANWSRASARAKSARLYREHLAEIEQVPKKTPAQLDREIAETLARSEIREIAERLVRSVPKSGARKKKKSADEIRTERLSALRGIMADAVGDDGWLEADPHEIEKWISVDDDLSEREWDKEAQNQLLDASVLPEHAGAPPPNVREWNDAFISTYRMNIDQGMNEEDAIDSARQNAYDTVTLESHEHGLTRTDPKLYSTKRRW